MRILFAGTPTPAVPSFHALLCSRHTIAAVLTRPDAPSGRGARLTPSPVSTAAREAGIPVLAVRSVRTPEFLEEVRALDVDAAAVVAYGALLRPPLLDLPRHGWVNLHFSLLPAWRGAAPVQAAIRAGDEVTGASTFRLEAGLDTGPVYGVVTEPIGPRDTAGALLDRLATSGAGLLVATFDGIEDGTLVPRPQPEQGVSLAPKITPADVEVRWTAPALAVDRLVRSATPDPGAWTDSPWGRLGLEPVELTDVGGLAPGEVSAGKREVLVGTGSTAVRLGVVRAAGRRPMPAADWARGTRPEPGSRLGAGPDPGIGSR
jgi:methionyl-tRNA formyltransferase